MPTPTVVPDGKRIEEIRTHLGLSVADVAERIPRYRHPRGIDHIEKGHRDRVSVTRIREIAEALGVKPEELIRQDAA